jgi:glycosyltransferase involved in cell wall biosynthesis
MTVRVFVPRWMDRSNTNAQNSNAKALLSRFSDPRASWTTISSEEPADSVRRNGCRVLHVSRSRWWPLELALLYQASFDAVFYPGPHWGDEAGLKIRTLVGRRTPVIATLEGIVTPPDSVKRLSDMAGHPVFAQPGTGDHVPRLSRLYQRADHIIAISPFLDRAATLLYGQKVSCLPLGIEGGIFHGEDRREPERCRVVSCGTVKSSKNPHQFLELAARYKEAEFVWFGHGEMVGQLTAEARRRDLHNLCFPGPLPPAFLADEFRKSSLFVLPSCAEGVPKVTQEAVACGLPVVLYGFFEAPTVVHELNGLVAWSDKQLSEHVGALIHDPVTRAKMGQQGVLMAMEWDWDRVAPLWEDAVIRLVT